MVVIFEMIIKTKVNILFNNLSPAILLGRVPIYSFTCQLSNGKIYTLIFMHVMR